VLIWHEIANDIVGGTAVVVTYCPLCNAALVFERVVDDRVLDFGTTGKLRNSDLVMYDRPTESWWQQFTGEAIVGAMTGRHLRLIPSRLESFDRFRRRSPVGEPDAGDRHVRFRTCRSPASGSPTGVTVRHTTGLQWQPGQASALDKSSIPAGRDVGNV